MTRMVPLKEAINIFEKHKLNKITNDNPLLYRSEWAMSDFSSTNYILDKIGRKKLNIEFENRFPDDDIKIVNKNLLKLVSKKFNRLDKEPYISEGLQLYGKPYAEITETPYGNSEIEFEKIYLHYYADASTDIEVDFETGKTIVTNKVQYDDWVDKHEPCDLFENYDYDSLYNHSINYTVMGSRKENKITYTDISVKLDELMELINSVFNIIPSEYTLIIDDMISKYADNINKVWGETKELHKQVHILVTQGKLEQESFDKNYRKTKSYEEDLDAFFKEDIKLQKEFNTEIRKFLAEQRKRKNK